MNVDAKSNKIDRSLLPLHVGYKETKPTLCIGLDIAWFGGSKKDPNSRYDFIAIVLVDSQMKVTDVEYLRVPLIAHDLDAKQTAAALNRLIKKYDLEGRRIVIAVDAPLQAEPRNLPVRKFVPGKGEVQRRACEEYLSCKRMGIDVAKGGANGWHPNIQPGAPLAPRVQNLLTELDSNFKLWTREKAEHKKLIIECFPAEAIWAAKRIGWFPPDINAIQAKAYKNQKGKQLTAQEVTDLVETILLPFAKVCGENHWKDHVVTKVIEQILRDNVDRWKTGEHFSGGKLIDDVVDSMICVATAIAYATNNAHVWQDLNHPDDGHIIGPGNMQELL
jgi:hypothetical protein